MGQDPQSWVDDPQMGGYHSCRGSPQRGEESSPYQALCRPGGPTLGQLAPKTSSIEGQQDLNAES